MYYNVMAENENVVKKQCMEILKAKEDYRKGARTYLRYIMKDLDQDTLMKCLEDLNIRELKQAIGSGVPGHAMHRANELLHEKKQKMEMFIEQDGKNASATVESENEKEDINDGESGICTSKEGRKSNSTTV